MKLDPIASESTVHEVLHEDLYLRRTETDPRKRQHSVLDVIFIRCETLLMYLPEV